MRPAFQSVRVFKRSKLISYAEARCAIPPLSLSLSSGDSEIIDTKFKDTVPSSQTPTSTSNSADLTASMVHHHTAIKTSNIEMSVAFYSLLDFHPVARFKAGPARAAWLEHCDDWDDERDECRCGSRSGGRSRIELIEVPKDMLYGPEEDSTKGPRKRAVDRISNPALLGWDHVCLDVTMPIQQMGEDNAEADPNQDEGGTEASKMKGGLQSWIAALNKRSQAKFGKDMRVALHPRVKLFGRERCEYAFIYDADGGLIELVNRLGTVGEDEGESTWDDLDDSRIIWRNG